MFPLGREKVLIAMASLPQLPPSAAAPISGPPMALPTAPMAQPVPVPLGAFQHGSVSYTDPLLAAAPS